MRWRWGKTPQMHACHPRDWRIVAEDTLTYIERCQVCGRERARIMR